MSTEEIVIGLASVVFVVLQAGTVAYGRTILSAIRDARAVSSTNAAEIAAIKTAIAVLQDRERLRDEARGARDAAAQLAEIIRRSGGVGGTYPPGGDDR